MDRFRELVPPCPRKMRRRCVSSFRQDFMFRPLGNQQLEQGRISVNGPSFGKSVSLFISLESAVCRGHRFERRRQYGASNALVSR